MSSLTPTHESVWHALAHGRSVLARYTLARTSEDLFNRSRALVEALRPCGIKAETSLDIQFANDTWLHIRRVVNVPLSPKDNDNLLVVELTE